MGSFEMNCNQILSTPEKLLFYLKVNRVLQTDADERYLLDCEDEYYELIESEEEEF